MPQLRKLNPDELQYLANQGVDTTSLADQQVTVMSPEEYSGYQADQQNQRAGILKGGILPTLKSHAGSLIGGGVSGTAVAAASEPLGLALAPFTFGTSPFWVPLVAGGLAAYGGSQVGNAVQKGAIEPMFMNPQQQAAEEQQAQLARKNYPVTSVATDVLGGALAGGGAPSLRAPVYAVKGIAQLAESGAATGIENQVYKHAVQNVITGNALNTALNAGVQYATTGHVDPLELGAAAIGGAVMSNPSPLGKALNPRWTTVGKVNGVKAAEAATPITVKDSLSMDPMNIADVEAYKKQAQKTTDEVNAGNADYLKQRQDYQARMTELDQQQQQAQQLTAQQRDQYLQQNWNTRNEQGDYTVPDKYVTKEFAKRYKVSTANIPPEQRAVVREQNAKLKDVPVEQQRQKLFEDDLQQHDPEMFQRYKTRQSVDEAVGKYNAALAEQDRIDQQHEMVRKMAEVRRMADEEAARQQQAAESQRRAEDFQKAKMELMFQQRQEEAQQQAQQQTQQQQQVAEQKQAQLRRIVNVPELQRVMQPLGEHELPQGEGRPLPTVENEPLTAAEQHQEDVNRQLFGERPHNEPVIERPAPALPPVRKATMQPTMTQQPVEHVEPQPVEVKQPEPTPKTQSYDEVLRSRGEDELPDYDEEFDRLFSARPEKEYLKEINPAMKEAVQDLVSDPKVQELYNDAGVSHNYLTSRSTNMDKAAFKFMRSLVNSMDVARKYPSQFRTKELELYNYIRANHPEFMHQVYLRGVRQLIGSGPSKDPYARHKAFALDKLREMGLTDYGDLPIKDWDDFKQEVWERAPGLAQWIETRLLPQTRPGRDWTSETITGEGETSFQPTGPGQRPTPEQNQRLLGEAAKHGVEVGEVPTGAIPMPGGGAAKGASYDPNEIGRRLIAVAREHATTDTGYHELVHSMIRDLKRSGNTKAQRYAATLEAAFGGEEPFAESAGKAYHNSVEKTADSTLGRASEYFKNVWANLKTAFGSTNPETLQRNLVAKMRNRDFENSTLRPEGGNGAGTRYSQLNDDKQRYAEIQDRMKQLMKDKMWGGEEFKNLWQEQEDIKNRYSGMPPRGESAPTTPPEGGTKFQPTTPGRLNPYRYTQSALDRIRTDINDPNGERVADSLHKTLIERQNLTGRWVNPVMDATSKLNDEQLARLDRTLSWESNNKQSGQSMLRGADERNAYKVIRNALLDNAKYRQSINEPVYRNGKPTPAQIDPWYYPTTTEPSVADTFRQNVDQPKIDQLRQDFLNQQATHGYTPAEAEQNYKDIVKSFQGSAQHADAQGNLAHFNAARKAQGIPLPDSWRRNDLRRNLDVYFRRQAADNSYFHNVETNHKVMSALGYNTDPWQNSINEPDSPPIVGNDAVKAVIGEIHGEFADRMARTQHAVEAGATAAMLGPLTETHKSLSTVSQSMVMADNPMEAAKVFTHAITHLGEGWVHAKETGMVQMDSKKASDFLNTHLTGAERLSGLTRAIRNVYTIGGLTEHFTKAYAQAAGEYLATSKVAAANNGDVQAQRLLHNVDPDFVVGKTYNPDEIKRLGSEIANVFHGQKDARTLPAWMLHDNEISAFMKLSSWNIAQTNNWVKNVWQPLRQDNNWKPLLMSALGATLGGAVIKQLREKLAGKESAIPSFAEIGASEGGYTGNLPAVAYNWMAMASYAGFAGILANVARYPFDIAFKNIPQGATFPLDELTTNTFNTARHIAEALVNDPNANLVDIGGAALTDFVKDNIQLGRVALNQGINTGVIGKGGLIDTELTRDLAYRKQFSDKASELRRFNMVSNLPYEAQEGMSGNPYLNLEQKRFKHEEDLNTAMEQLPPLINNIMTKFGDRPEVMMAKFRALKANNYEIMPSMEEAPMAFMRYLSFLSRRDGPEAATQRFMDYIQHETSNRVKSSLVP